MTRLFLIFQKYAEHNPELLPAEFAKQQKALPKECAVRPAGNFHHRGGTFFPVRYTRCGGGAMC